MESKLRDFVQLIVEQSKNALHYSTEIRNEEKQVDISVVFSSTKPTKEGNVVWINSKDGKVYRLKGKESIPVHYYGDLFSHFPKSEKKVLTISDVKNLESELIAILDGKDLETKDIVEALETTVSNNKADNKKPKRRSKGN